MITSGKNSVKTRFEIYMVVDNDKSTTHLIFSGEFSETVAKLGDLNKAIPFAKFEWEDGETINI